MHGQAHPDKFLWRRRALHVGHKNPLAFHRVDAQGIVHGNESRLLAPSCLDSAGEGVERLPAGVWQHVELLPLRVVAKCPANPIPDGSLAITRSLCLSVGWRMTWS